MHLSKRATAIALTLTAFACSQGGSKQTESGKAASGAASQPSSKPGSQSATGGSTKGLSASDRDAVDEDGIVRRGVALSAAPTLTVAQVHEQAETLKGKSVKVTGEVSSVCTKSGCWFILREDGKNVRITSKGYKYFVPRDSIGRTATVEGELSAKMLDQKTAQHYEEDKAASTGEPVKQVEGPIFEIAVASVGLEMTKK